MKSYLSIALLSKNPCEEKSLFKRLDEIEKMKRKILRESAAKMSSFALQHLYIAKYYDAKNGEQCRPPPKVSQNGACPLPRLAEKPKQGRNPHFLDRAEPSADCTTSMPKSRRSLSEKCVPLTPKSTERDHAPVESKAPSISSQPNYVPRIASAQKSEPKYRRSVSDVVAPIPSLMSVGEDAESEYAPRKSNAWDLKEDKENLKSCNNALLKRKVSQYLAPKLEDIVLEGCKRKESESVPKDDCEAAPDEGRKAVVPIQRRQRRATVAGERPSLTREFNRWQKTVRLVKDLPKHEQAEILRGACFLRMAVPGFNSAPIKTEASRPPTQLQNISTRIPPRALKIEHSTLDPLKFAARTK